jgi:Peptidase C13 family
MCETRSTRCITKKGQLGMAKLRRSTHNIMRAIATAALSAMLAIIAATGPVSAQRATTPAEAQARLNPRAIADAQADLLLKSAAKLEASRPDRPEVYFLGFASFAGQDVFKRELTAVQSIIQDRFGARGRSLVLLNHRETTATNPLATARNLNIALQAIGERMDVDKDVLMLFITTHGLPGRLAVDFSPTFRMRDLDPASLARSLDDAGIKNRVLVISACYSGSFLPVLANANSLVITAARADRTSFGCSNTRSWTYFGDAFFNRALRQTHNLPDAFQQAFETVSTWEKQQKLTPSEPQIHLGANIKPKLDDLVRRLAQATPVR